jgi:hypothetical protein
MSFARVERDGVEFYKSRVKPLCLVPGDVSAVDEELMP